MDNKEPSTNHNATTTAGGKLPTTAADGDSQNCRRAATAVSPRGPLFRWGPLVVAVWTVAALPGLGKLTAWEGLTVGILSAGLLFSLLLVRKARRAGLQTTANHDGKTNEAVFHLFIVFVFLNAVACTVPLFQVFGGTAVAAATPPTAFLPGVVAEVPSSPAGYHWTWLFLCLLAPTAAVLLELLDRLTPDEKAATGGSTAEKTTAERTAAEKTTAEKTTAERTAAERTAAEKVERFFAARGPRGDLLIGAFAVGALGYWLHGGGKLGGVIGTAAAGGVLLFLLAAVRPLLRLQKGPARPSGGKREESKAAQRSRFLTGCALLLTATGAGLTAWRYERLWALTNEGTAALAAEDETRAKAAFAAADRLNTALRARTPDLAAERSRAAWLEKHGRLDEALKSWERVARLCGAPPSETSPVLRAWCRKGASLPVWRRFVFRGFVVLDDDELQGGIRALGDAPTGNLPGRLLAVFEAWRRGAPKMELRRRLRKVLELNKRDVSAHALLDRLDGKTTPAGEELNISRDLFVAKRPSPSSYYGTLNESGRLSTAAVLERGTWEVRIEARGTPLDDLWPVVTLEVNGRPLLRRQVRGARRGIFSFGPLEVVRADLYRLTLVFTNREERFVRGRRRRRSLELYSLRFHKVTESGKASGK